MALTFASKSVSRIRLSNAQGSDSLPPSRREEHLVLRRCVALAHCHEAEGFEPVNSDGNGCALEPLPVGAPWPTNAQFMCGWWQKVVFVQDEAEWDTATCDDRPVPGPVPCPPEQSPDLDTSEDGCPAPVSVEDEDEVRCAASFVISKGLADPVGLDGGHCPWNPRATTR